LTLVRARRYTERDNNHATREGNHGDGTGQGVNGDRGASDRGAGVPAEPGVRRAGQRERPAVYERAAADPEAFWADWAKQLDWIRPWDRVCEWNRPHAKWFLGGQLNVSANCLDRHVRTARRNKAAIVFEGEPATRAS
jgi:hypothetical protein